MNDTPFTLVASEPVAQRILLSKGHKVMTDADSTDLYKVLTKALKQAIRRNIEHLPSNFKYQLTVEEKQIELERKISNHKQTIAGLIDDIRQLIHMSVGSSRPIGFTAGIIKHRSK
jgi:hypothetical protein